MFLEGVSKESFAIFLKELYVLKKGQGGLQKNR